MTKILSLIFISLTLFIQCNVPFTKYDHHKSDYVPKHFSLVKIYVSDKFSDRERLVIYDAVDIWNYTANGNIVFFIALSKNNAYDFGESNTCNYFMEIAPISSSTDTVKEKDKKREDGTKLLGYASHKNCYSSKIRLVIDRLASDDKLTWVTLHEIGHGLGLKHLEDRGPIMYKNYNSKTSCSEGTCCIKKEDMIQLCKKYECNINSTQYCY